MSFKTTAEKVKRALRIPAALTDNDTLIGEFIDGVHAAILADIGGGLTSDDPSTSYSAYFDINSGGKYGLRLPKWPVTQITTVYTGTNYGASGTALPTTDYACTGVGTLTLTQTGASWPVGRQNVRVVWTAGIAAGSTDEVSLELAERLTVVAAFKASGMMGVSSERIGSYSYTKDAEETRALYPPLAATIINRYRSVVPSDANVP